MFQKIKKLTKKEYKNRYNEYKDVFYMIYYKKRLNILEKLIKNKDTRIYTNQNLMKEINNIEYYKTELNKYYKKKLIWK